MCVVKISSFGFIQVLLGVLRVADGTTPLNAWELFTDTVAGFMAALATVSTPECWFIMELYYIILLAGVTFFMQKIINSELYCFGLFGFLGYFTLNIVISRATTWEILQPASLPLQF